MENNAKIYYEADADLELITRRKIAIIGYGAQGRAHSLNLRDSGCDVIVGQRPGPGFDKAVSDGFQPIPIGEAASAANVINVMLPDEVHGEVFEALIKNCLSPGDIMITCHGFSFHYQLMNPPAGVESLLVAPKGQGHMVRGEYERGGGVPCLIAISEGSSEETFQIGLAYAKAIGGTKAGVIPTTIAAETETDLFGEQAVLCGGVSALVKAGFQTLVDAGYQPELAYFECLHELKIIVDLLHRGGLNEMREAISNTAEYGDYVSGPAVIDDHVQDRMKQVLSEIQNGNFAKRFLAQHQSGGQEMESFRGQDKDHLIESTGTRLRELMPWLQDDKPK